MNPVRQLLLRYLGRHRPRLAAGMVLIAGSALTTTVLPLFIGQAVDVLTRDGPQSTVLLLAVAIVAVAGAQALLHSVGRLLISYVGRDVEYEMRRDLYGHLQGMHAGYFQHQRIGDLMARMTNDLNAVRQMLSGGLISLVGTLFTVAFTVASMVAVSPKLTLVALLLLPIASVAFLVVGRRVRRLFDGLQAQFGELSVAAQENLSGIRVIKVFNQEPAEVLAFARHNDEYVARAIRLARVQDLVWPIMEGVVGVAVLAALYVGGLDAIRGGLSLGQIVQFIAYVGLLAWPLEAIGWVYSLFQSGLASLERLREINAVAPRISDPVEPRPAPADGAIELRDVSFSHAGVRVLDHVSLSVAAGETLAIVGPTGAGKSSLVGLLTRQFDVDAGQVLLDGRDVRDYSLRDLRVAVGVAPQDPFFFSTSLRANIAFGVDAEVPDERIAWAARVSRLDADADAWPEGYDTIIGERGVTLSGGQKQRLAIARAIAKESRVLVLDDAFSAVDAATEAEIRHRLDEAVGHRTRIVIAHRMSTVRQADQIAVLDGGRIVERGSHGELADAGGWYATTFHRQQIEERPAEDEGAPDR